jgi:UDP-N-acetylglucosamine 2-epimerase (non-hydrolysing)
VNPAALDLVAGARPNFMKLAPVHRALSAYEQLIPRIVHTGQHYDASMNDVFFAELEIPEPAVHLEVGSGSHGVQTARILERYEKHLLEARPAATVVFGDVNSTVACALAAVKLGVPVVHVEAGLRSFDRTMPEEINRILTDAISDLLLVSEPSGLENLKHEGIPDSKVRLVGNVMIDTLVRELERADDSVLERLGVKPGEYGLVTMHRPSNVDDPAVLERMLALFAELGKRLPLVFPVHPRTRDAAERAGLQRLLFNEACFRAVEPLSYRENLALMCQARVVLTDSGGMQEETTHLRVPCLTLRENTERPVTTQHGTSKLVGNDPQLIRAAFNDAINHDWSRGTEIPLWDGHAGERAATQIARQLLAGAWV